MKKVLVLIFVAIVPGILFSTDSAQHNNRLLMIMVEKEHCYWCHKMEKEIFSDPRTVAKLRKKFYVVQITVESGNLPQFVHPKYFPTTFVYSPEDLKLIDSLAGYRKKEKFLKFFDTDYDVHSEI